MSKRFCTSLHSTVGALGACRLRHRVGVAMRSVWRSMLPGTVTTLGGTAFLLPWASSGQAGAVVGPVRTLFTLSSVLNGLHGPMCSVTCPCGVGRQFELRIRGIFLKSG